MALPRLIADLFADLRFGLRQLTRNLAVSLIGVLTLAVGIGANVTSSASFTPSYYAPCPSQTLTNSST